LSDYALVFAMVFLTAIVITDSRLLLLQRVEELSIQYDNAIDNAVQDAMDDIVEMADRDVLKINKQELLERFFMGLSINLGLSEGDSAREKLEYYFPVLALMLQDGLYVWKLDENGKGKEFSEKIPYCLERETYRVSYTFEDIVVYEDKKRGTQLRGLYQEVRKQYPIQEFSDEIFDEMRRRTIISTITKELDQMLEEHNRFAELGGMNYYFSLPVIDMEEWYRTVDDVTMLCVFQGYPYHSRQLGTYHKTVLSGARIHKDASWEPREDTLTGKEILNGEEEYYTETELTDEWEDNFFKEIETENIVEE